MAGVINGILYIAGGVIPNCHSVNTLWAYASVELQVVNGNKVERSGHLVQRGKKREIDRPVEGTVNGKKVELTSQEGREIIKYVLTFADGNLIGTGNRGNDSTPVETTFRKL